MLMTRGVMIDVAGYKGVPMLRVRDAAAQAPRRHRLDGRARGDPVRLVLRLRSVGWAKRPRRCVYGTNLLSAVARPIRCGDC
jgi:hypothetical protein